MSAVHEPFDELAAVYALGALAGPERVRFEEHLRAGCEDCERVLAEYRDTLVRASAELSLAPPPRLRQALLARLAEPGRVPARTPWLRVAGAMALAAGIAAAAVWAPLHSRYQERLAGMEGELAALRAVVTAQRQTLALLRDPATRVVHLAGLDPSPQARARVIWNERRGGVFVAADLPAAPPDKVYELWAIAGGKPRPAGLFRVDTQGTGTVDVAPLADVPAVEQFAVTLEPAAGVPAPTGAMYLASPANPNAAPPT